MRIFGIILCLTALGLTGYSALTFKAPQIEADLEMRSVDALSDLAGDDVEVRVDGRHVTLQGKIADDERRRQVLQAVSEVPGALGPIDNLQKLAVAAPYRFGAVKDEDGGVVVEGLAPTEEIKASIEADASAIFGSDTSVEIGVAAGGPSGDWLAAAGVALDALATMKHGRLSISDSDVVIEGQVASDADVEAIDIFAEMAPEGFTWTHDISVQREKAEPFTFSVVKDAEGGLRLEGFAPDEETRAALIGLGERVVGDKPLISDIRIADGMPDDEWPSLVQAGISAMKEMASGRFDVVGNDVSFSSESAATTDGPPDDGTDGRTSPAADGSTDAAAKPAGNASERVTPVLTIDKVEEGLWSIRGIVPDQESEETLVDLISDQAGVDEVEVELDRAGDEADDVWTRFAADHLRTLDEVRAGRLSLEDFEAHLIGVVDTPDDVETVEAALLAIDQEMTVDLQPVDPRPTASLDLRVNADDGVVLDGALPGGLSEGEALLALGIRRYDGELEENGRGGRPDLWQQDLSQLGAVLPAFERIDVSLGAARRRIEGRLHAHVDADQIEQDLESAFDGERRPEIDIAPTEAVHDDGARRTNPLTGDEEFHRQGYWLPVVEIAADRDSCSERASTMLEADKITFLRGEDDLDRRAERTLNALAALAIACLEDPDLVLEIGGHTDSRGAADMNQELSQARADRVLRALTARGVDRQSLIAVGYGDARPVADNASDEGRAANRRITFEWKPSADVRISGAEG